MLSGPWQPRLLTWAIGAAGVASRQFGGRDVAGPVAALWPARLSSSGPGLCRPRSNPTVGGLLAGRPGRCGRRRLGRVVRRGRVRFRGPSTLSSARSAGTCRCSACRRHRPCSRGRSTPGSPMPSPMSRMTFLACPPSIALRTLRVRSARDARTRDAGSEDPDGHEAGEYRSPSNSMRRPPLRHASTKPRLRAQGDVVGRSSTRLALGGRMFPSLPGMCGREDGNGRTRGGRAGLRTGTVQARRHLRRARRDPTAAAGATTAFGSTSQKRAARSASPRRRPASSGACGAMRLEEPDQLDDAGRPSGRSARAVASRTAPTLTARRGPPCGGRSGRTGRRGRRSCRRRSSRRPGRARRRCHRSCTRSRAGQCPRRPLPLRCCGPRSASRRGRPGAAGPPVAP